MGPRALKGPLSEKAMATHSSTLAWKIPWAEEPGGLQSMGSQKKKKKKQENSRKTSTSDSLTMLKLLIL